MPKQIRCSSCGDLGHNKRSPVCEEYFKKVLLWPTRLMEDGIPLTKAVNRIRKFIDKRPGILLKEFLGAEDFGCLPLHWVCEQHCPLQVVQLVYEKYPEAIEIESNDGFLPLNCMFSKFGFCREDVIRFVISKDPDARTHCPDCDQIPLHDYCETMTYDASEETLDELLSNCPETLWTERPEDDRNALQISSSGNLRSMLRKKIVHYAREFKSTNSHENFLHLYRSNCFDEPTLKLYCEEWPDFAYFDLERGARPLHIACSSAILEYVVDNDVEDPIRYLITRAPDVLTLQDSSGCTPLHLLLGNEGLGYIDFDADDLISLMLKFDPKVLTVRDNKGFTPLHTACSTYDSHHYDFDVVLERSRYLITRAPDVLALQDSSGCTPLHLLLAHKDQGHGGFDSFLSLISFILNANPKVLTVRDNKGFTPLLVASQSHFSLNVIYSMLRFEPQLNLSSSWFSDSKMCTPIQRKRKR